MKRIALVLLALPILGWLGFQLWLVQQPEELRATVGQMSTREFWRVVRETYGARELNDFGRYGRTIVAGRGHAPWVLRSNLDGYPRMLLVALAPGHWLSLHTETGSLHQFWKGDVHFAGPAYDTYHGQQPTSTGDAYWKAPPASAFRVWSDGQWREAPAIYRGHSLSADARTLSLRYALGSGSDAVVLTVTPDLAPSADGSRAQDDGARIGLERRFSIERNPLGIRVAVALPGGALDLEGAHLVGPPASRLAEITDAEATAVQRFGEPAIALSRADAAQASLDASLPGRLIAGADCLSCHAAHERVVGPSWREVAERHADEERAGAIAGLAERIRHGSRGRWGQAAMPAHPGLAQAAAEQMAWSILATANGKASDEQRALHEVAARERFHWSYDTDTEARPAALHPSLRKRRLDVPPFTPAVGGLALLGDGRLAVATWDRDGAIYAVEHWDDELPVRVERIAEGLHEPLGLAVVGDALYVMQKQELTQLVDHDGDGRIDEYRVVNASWQTSGNFHEFGFGLVERGGFLYGGLSACVEYGGKSCAVQLPDRGRVFRVSLASGALEFVASGFRTPNGFAVAPDGELYVTDNQGDWLPASKLIRVREGSFHGWRSPLDALRAMPATTAPALWLPQNEIGNSPTQPVFLRHGPYAGQVLFGDVYNGGIKRAALEEVNGQVQGAAFHFTGGLAGGVNRLLESADGRLVVGEIGNPGNWGEVGKDWFGLEILEYTGEFAFEPRAVRATARGFEVEFTRPLAASQRLTASTVRAQHWFYVPSSLYGGPKYDPAALEVENLALSADRRTLAFDVPGREAGRVVYLRFGRSLRSDDGERLWVNEAWYTLNEIPVLETALAPAVGAGPATRAGVPAPANTLTAHERSESWRLLFDGESFRGWRNYGAEDDETIEGWAVEDGTLRMTRDVSYARFIWNFVNPFAERPLLDLRTEEKFGPRFELSIDWKISTGGNSGIFYLVPDDRARVPWKLGLEMQVLDDDVHSDGRIEKRRAGDLYDLVASRGKRLRPVGEWNTARVRVDGDHIQHWLNGVLIVDVKRAGPDWQVRVADSKFADREGYGQAPRGHIVLQDHGDSVWYRNVKLRTLP